jgi:hypothetical protein
VIRGQCKLQVAITGIRLLTHLPPSPHIFLVREIRQLAELSPQRDAAKAQLDESDSKVKNVPRFQKYRAKSETSGIPEEETVSSVADDWDITGFATLALFRPDGSKARGRFKAPRGE